MDAPAHSPESTRTLPVTGEPYLRRPRDVVLALVYAAGLFVALPIAVWRVSEPAPPSSETPSLPLVWFEAVEPVDPLPDPPAPEAPESPSATTETPPSRFLDSAPGPSDARGIDLGSFPMSETPGWGLVLANAARQAPVAPPAPPDRPAHPLAQPEPVYPPAARLRGVSGAVVVEFTVAEDGRTCEATILEAQPAGIFDATVLRAVEAWRFVPASRGTQPVRTRLRQTVRFRPE